MQRTSYPKQQHPPVRALGAIGLALALILSTTALALPLRRAEAAAITVTASGIPADGSDVTSRLQALLGTGGKSLYFPAGTYRFAGVSVPADTTLAFASGAVVLPGYNGGNFLNVNGSRVTITGGEFDGQGTLAIAVMGNGVSALTVDGVTAKNMLNGNVNVVGCTDVVVRNTRTTDSQYGIVVSGTQRATIDGTYAYGMGRDGILVYSSSYNVTISNNYVERWATLSQDGRAAIHTYGSADLKVFGNTVKNGTYNAEGIRFRDSERFDAYDNVVDNVGGAGIAAVYIGDWAAVNGLVGGDGTIRNNAISNARLRGVAAAYTQIKPVRILNNLITNTTSAYEPIDPADAVIALAPGSAVVGNTIVNSTGNGVRTGANCLVADNTITNVGTGAYGARSGVFAQGAATIVRNTIQGSKTYGVYATAPVYLEANTISGAAYGSLNLSAGTGSRYANDYTAPTVSSNAVASYDSPSGSIAVNASDGGSGVVAVMANTDGTTKAYGPGAAAVPVGPAGGHTLTYWAVDQAGNASAFQIRSYSVGSVVVQPPVVEPTVTPPPSADPTTPVTPPPVAVEAPTAIAASTSEYQGDSIVTLTWQDNSTNESGFAVERAYEHDGVLDDWVYIDTAAPDTTSYYDRVAQGSFHRYRVRAFVTGSPIVYSDYSAEISVASPVVEPPVVTPPSDPVVTPPSDPSVDPVVTPPSDPVVTPPSDPSVDPVVTPPSDPGVDPVITPPSDPGVDPVVTTSSPDPLTPGAGVAAPIEFAASTSEYLGSTIVALTWRDASDNESGFAIERALERDGMLDPWVYIDTVPSGATAYYDRVPAGSAYQYRVRAFVTGSPILYSAFPIPVRVGPIVQPPISVMPTLALAGPTALTYTTGSRRVSLRWSDNALNETGYEVWRKTALSWSRFSTLHANSTSFESAPMRWGVYEFKVRAFGDSGYSAFSPSVIVFIWP